MRPWHVAIMLLTVTACTGTGDPPATTATTPGTTRPTTTTTTLLERCPDAFCLVYHIRPEAAWSDGVPVSAGDFVHTFNTFRSNPGYELISGYEVIDDKTLLVAFSEAYGPWQTLFAIVLPAHAVPNRSMPASGPFVLGEEGDGAVVLHRNDQYWAAGDDPISGQPRGDVTEIRLVVIEAVRERIRALEIGEVDLIELDPLDWMVDEVAAMESVAHRLAPGPVWEQITFNHDDPMLSQRWVREVIAMAIDRERLLDDTVRTIHPEAAILGRILWPVTSGDYVDHFPPGHRHDPEAVLRTLADRGCIRGEDGIHTCQGQRLSFVWATTAGDPIRERLLELVREELVQVGIELVAEMRAPANMFSDEFLFAGSGTWQIANFSWRFPDDPRQAETMFHCQGTAPSGFGRLNVGRYCNPEIEALVVEAAMTVDPDARAGLYRQAERAYLADLGIIPLYQRPILVAWADRLDGPEESNHGSDLVWNAASWRGMETVTVALAAPPMHLDPAQPLEDTSAMILAVVLQGAYGVTPSLESTPVLVEEVEVLVREP